MLTSLLLYSYCTLLRIRKILLCSALKHLGKILLCLPTRFGQIHKKIIATITCRCTGDITLERGYELECLLYKRQHRGRRYITLHYEIVAGKATHRAPIDYAACPLTVVTQESGSKMLYCMYGTWAKHRFTVRFFHAYIESGYGFAAYHILTRNIYAALQAYMVYCKARNLFHNL